ncbi:MAG TPA: histidine--tRNA ligase [Clostridia bacterium]|nr:histidine--tRNA ligase [Clostridia bacterium]HHY06881.1 histidine--tRNA ligase [Clostridia bacterium]
MLTTKPRGTNDLLPQELEKWHYVENIMREVATLYGYQEIRTPIFEHTELFQRGVGETTDIVEKEMYTFLDRGKRSLTLRPEATASTVRAFLENKLYADPLPVKLYYLGPMFRYDRPQAGRYRQFHQFGVEVFGSQSPSLDAEVIAMAMDIYERLGLHDLVVELNSVGCPQCRRAHKKVLQDYLQAKLADLCPTCQGRFEKNPLRILDCKNGRCQNLVAEAPKLEQMLCEECRRHFQLVQDYLQELQVPYTLNSCLVRGLDYYTKTAFEIVAQGIGAQSSIGGGGRYDRLIEECGGPSLPGIGYAMGIERILLTLEEQGIEFPLQTKGQIFIATLGEKAQKKGAKLAQELRKAGLMVERDYLERSLKAQLKAANRLQVSITVILGEEELAQGEAVVRDMQAGGQKEIPLQELVSYLVKKFRGGKQDE